MPNGILAALAAIASGLAALTRYGRPERRRERHGGLNWRPEPAAAAA